MSDQELDFVKESLPHDLGPYQKAAQSDTQKQFESRCPYPFLLFARSQLWDPSLLQRSQGSPGEDEDSGTMVVRYDIGTGGRVFLSPVRKRQTDPNSPSISLGRGTQNDLVVPTRFVSNVHLHFESPRSTGKNRWMITDLGSTNGTWLEEEQLKPNAPTKVEDAQYLRLGGNMIAWFLYPGHLWQLFHNPKQLRSFTDL